MHEMREAGENRRILEELQFLRDGMGTKSNVSVRRYRSVWQFDLLYCS
jgi:hypothetical protein